MDVASPDPKPSREDLLIQQRNFLSVRSMDLELELAELRLYADSLEKKCSMMISRHEAEMAEMLSRISLLEQQREVVGLKRQRGRR